MNLFLYKSEFFKIVTILIIYYSGNKDDFFIMYF